MKGISFLWLLCLPLCGRAQTEADTIIAEQVEKAKVEILSTMRVIDMASEMSKLDPKGLVLKTTLTLYPNLRERIRTAADLQAAANEGALREWVVESVSVPIFAHFKAEGAKRILRGFLMTF